MKRILTNAYLGIFSLCSLALLLFFVYVLIRKMNGGCWVCVIENLHWGAVIIGLLMGLVGFVIPYFLWKDLPQRKVWARIMLWVLSGSSMLILYLGYQAIEDIEWVYFPKSPYRRMFIWGAIPLVAGTALMVVGQIAGLLKKTSPAEME